MKFKSEEELMDSCSIGGSSGKYGVAVAFKSFAERIEFFRKYEFNEELLKIDDVDGWKKFFNDYKSVYEEGVATKRLIYWFNCWLFNYCFGDIK